MAKYRKKPLIVNAEQFFPDRKPWPKGVEEKPGGYCTTTDDGDWCEIHKRAHRKPAWRIETLTGPYGVRPGNWIVMSASSVSVQDDEFFKEVYEAVV